MGIDFMHLVTVFCSMLLFVILRTSDEKKSSFKVTEMLFETMILTLLIAALESVFQ